MRSTASPLRRERKQLRLGSAHAIPCVPPAVTRSVDLEYYVSLASHDQRGIGLQRASRWDEAGNQRYDAQHAGY